MKRNNYILIQDWMVEELNLKGNELLVYALINGFSQDDESCFNGSIQYLSNLLNITRRCVINVLSSLVEKGYLTKTTKILDGVTTCEYRRTNFRGSEKNSLGSEKNSQGGSEKNSPNNKVLENKIIKEEKYKKEEKCEIPYVEIIDYLNLKTKSHYKYNTNKTRDCIKARWNEGFTLEDFKKVIDNKSKEWLGDPKYENYLRPETLFGNKFEGYLNSKSTKRYLGNKQVKDTPNWYEDYQREVSNLIENNKAKNGEEKNLKELEDFFGVNKEAEK